MGISKGFFQQPSSSPYQNDINRRKNAFSVNKSSTGAAGGSRKPSPLKLGSENTTSTSTTTSTTTKLVTTSTTTTTTTAFSGTHSLGSYFISDSYSPSLGNGSITFPDHSYGIGSLNPNEVGAVGLTSSTQIYINRYGNGGEDNSPLLGILVGNNTILTLTQGTNSVIYQCLTQSFQYLDPDYIADYVEALSATGSISILSPSSKDFNIVDPISISVTITNNPVITTSTTTTTTTSSPVPPGLTSSGNYYLDNSYSPAPFWGQITFPDHSNSSATSSPNSVGGSGSGVELYINQYSYGGNDNSSFLDQLLGSNFTLKLTQGTNSVIYQGLSGSFYYQSFGTYSSYYYDNSFGISPTSSLYVISPSYKNFNFADPVVININLI